MLTTVIGAYPKPSFLQLPDWFNAEGGTDTLKPTVDYDDAIKKIGKEAESIFLKAAKEVKQANFAIAVPYPGTVFHDMATSGKDGIELLTEDFSEYKRYGHAVTNVGRLSSQDLLRLQNEGFVSIYSKYWRWWSVIRRWGLMGLLLTFYRMLIMVIGKARHKYTISRAESIHPSLR